MCDIPNDQFRCLVLNFTEQMGVFLLLFDDLVTKGIIAEFNDFQMLAEALRMSVSHFFPSLESEAASKQRLIVAFPVTLLVFLFFFSVLIFLLQCRKSFCMGFVLKSSQLAFSQPTSAGMALASNYFGSVSFLVYRTNKSIC